MKVIKYRISLYDDLSGSEVDFRWCNSMIGCFVFVCDNFRFYKYSLHTFTFKIQPYYDC